MSTRPASRETALPQLETVIGGREARGGSTASSGLVATRPHCRATTNARWSTRKTFSSVLPDARLDVCESANWRATVGAVRRCSRRFPTPAAGTAGSRSRNQVASWAVGLGRPQLARHPNAGRPSLGRRHKVTGLVAVLQVGYPSPRLGLRRGPHPVAEPLQPHGAFPFPVRALANRSLVVSTAKHLIPFGGREVIQETAVEWW